MKHLLLTTIAAVVLVGCGGPSVDIWTATAQGNIEAVKQHLAAGADVNAMAIGWTPLHFAAANDHKELAELLIAKGADVSAKGDGERTPLHEAATFGHKEIVELLIAKGADVKTAGERTPLHMAAIKGHKEIIELLIAAGADVNVKMENGMTPLDYAIRRKRTETADLLRKHGGKTGAELKAEGK